MVPVEEGIELWRPTPKRVERAELTRYTRGLYASKGLYFENYGALWRWSVEEPESFWSSIVQFFDLRLGGNRLPVLQGSEMPSMRWFPEATVNYAEHALRHTGSDIAIVARDEAGARHELSFDTLRDQVARARTGLMKLGVGRGDRVCAFLPNGPEAIIGFLATASLGAVWSSCSPEFGVASVLDRFAQVKPKVLLATDGYQFGGKRYDRTTAVREIAQGLANLDKLVLVSRLGKAIPDVDAISFDELAGEVGPLEFEQVPFEHPLWVLYSSGTTGLPKPIVHGHGGILLEHCKALSLHSDLRPGSRFFWYTTTGWMMWNFLVSGLLVGSRIVLYDGSPGYPDLGTLWKLSEEEGLHYFGTSAPYLLACRKADLKPGRLADLSELESLGTTGAPLPADGFSWVYKAVKKDLLLGSISGGTDVCTAFVLSCPLLPVRAGHIQCRGLGAKVEAFDEAGRSLTDTVGELVLTEPLPSMPIYFWGDAEGERYRESYFSDYPGVWRHGDWIKVASEGGCVIYGRSDSTLNRGGVRIGTSELYRVVEDVPGVQDSLVVDTGSLDHKGKLWLFLVLEGSSTATLDIPEQLQNSLKERIKSELSPRHIPDEFVSVSKIPRTINGKKLEVPVKKILTGTDPERAVNRDTLADPTALDVFIEIASQTSRRTYRSLSGMATKKVPS